MHRLHLELVALLLACASPAALAQGPAKAAPAAKPLNIVFVFSDDHAYQAIGAYGSRINTTPHIDSLASAGMRFDRCCVTNSICAPSRAVILTGKYSHVNGHRVNGPTFDGSQQTFPKLLQGAGYQTAIFGKWHLRSEPTGFDAWEVLPGQGHYYNPDFRTAEGIRRVPGYVTNAITDRALRWLEKERDPARPFMLMVQNKAPHREWEPGPEHLALYDDADIPEPPTLFDDYSDRASPARLQKMTIAHHMRLGSDLKVWTEDNRKGGGFERTYARMTPEQRARWDAAYDPRNRAFLAAGLEGDALVHWKYQRYIKDYLRCIASVDDNVGRLLDYLEREGLTDSTVVMYSSDQGFYLGEHGWFDKRWMYEESFRTPLIVRWPGVTAPGSSSKRIVSNLDFAETFLELAGVEVPSDMQGRSLVPILRGEQPASWRKSLYYHYYEAGGHGVPAHYGVTTDRYKLIHYYAYPDREIDEWELFDLEKDPREMHSVYAAPDYAKVLEEMRAELKRLRAELAIDR